MKAGGWRDEILSRPGLRTSTLFCPSHDSLPLAFSQGKRKVGVFRAG